MATPTLSLQVEHVREIAPGVRYITFRLQDEGVLRFKPGQFITLLLPNGDAFVRRNYSIASMPTDAAPDTEIDLIEIAITHVPGGIASEHLFAISPGDKLTAQGPNGRLLLRKEDKPARFILVATGTGVTPYRAMLPQLAARLAEDPKLEVILLFGIRSPQHVLYADDFVAFAKAQPHFTWHRCYSRTLPDAPDANQHTGYVQQFLKTLSLSATQDIVYLCGNSAMVDEIYDHLKTHAFTVDNVRREKYISAR